MKRFPIEFNNDAIKRIKNDDDLLFQGNEQDEDLIAHLVDIEPVVLQQTQTIPNPPMANESCEFSDDLDDAAFKELQVQESEFLRQTQVLDISPPNSYMPLFAYTSNHELHQNNQINRFKDDLEKVSLVRFVKELIKISND
jgi:hypothetical protein